MEVELLKKKVNILREQSEFVKSIWETSGIILPTDIVEKIVTDHIWYLYEENADNPWGMNNICLFKCIICGDTMYNKLVKVEGYVLSDNEKYKNKNLSDLDRKHLYAEARKKYLQEYANYIASCINNDQYIDRRYVYKANNGNKY